MDTKKLDRWASLLLDTGKRNNLVNFKDTKASTVEIILPNPEDLFERVESSVSFEVFDPKIADDEDEDYTSDQSSDDSEEDEKKKKQDKLNRQDYIDTYGSRIRKNNQILLYNANVSPVNALKNIDKKAREHLEETGVNVAYIAFGFIHWKERADSAYVFRAPILLAPVTFSNVSAVDPWFVKMTEDDVVVNPTFSFKMDAEQGMQLPEYENEGLDEYLGKVERLVSKIGWTVTKDCKIGIFSFLKMNMYQDLMANKDTILQNSNVRMLLGEPFDAEQGVSIENGEHHLNNALIELHNVVDADSSQIEAIEMAKAGVSFVLQGPPGTGKSQTITNIIAECLHDGKKVLFVSEKQAALNVVYDKLKKAGLQEFCLELHSYKSNKKDVIDNLCKTLRTAKTSVSAQAEDEIDAKIKSQKELDTYEEELHQHRDVINKSLYQLYDAYASNRKAPDVRVSIRDIGEKGDEYLKNAKSLLEQYVAFVPSIGYQYKNNPWYGYMNQDTSYQMREDIRKSLGDIVAVLEKYIELQKTIEEKYGISCNNLKQTELWDNFFTLASESQILTPSFLKQSACAYLQEKLTEMETLGSEIVKIRDDINRNYDADLYKMDAADAYKRLTRVYTSWFGRLFNGEYRQLITDIKLNAKNGKKPSYQEAIDLTNNLSIYQEKQAAFDEMEGPLKTSLGSAYHGVDSDWNMILKQISRLKELFDSGASFSKLELFTNVDYEEQKSDFAVLAKQIEELKGKCEKAVELLSKSFDSSVCDVENSSFEQLSSKLSACLKNYDKLDNWSRFDSLLKKLKEQQITEYIDAVIEANVRAEDIVSAYQRNFYRQWIDYVQHLTPVLSGFNRVAHDQQVDIFSREDNTQFAISKVQIRAKLSQNRPSLDFASPGSAVSIVLREGEKKRKQKSIRTLMGEAGELIQVIKPCFLMSPLSVSTFLNTESVKFDTVVFDEASQIFPQDAIGAIYRGKQLIVVGDSKQMPPSNFFSSNVELDDNDEETGDITDFESILDLCSTAFAQLRLRWHYRSRYEQLITFSNRCFYDNDLVTFPSSATDRKWIGVDYYCVEEGIFDHKSRNNRKEAEFIVDLIYKNIELYPERSLGVVAFSVSQQDLIDKLLSKRRQEDPSKEFFFRRDAAEPFFIKNLETVQGDERDTIIFSVAYAKDSTGRLMHNFGPLNRVGGERRLNVAVTRAKLNVQLVASIHHTDIDLGRTKAEGAKLLKNYLDYAENGTVAMERAVSVNPFEQFDSEFEMEVCEFLRDNGYEVDTQVGCSNFRIDLGIKRAGTSDYVLAVECDGATYHSSKNARDRDRLRQQILENMGWKFYRIWSTDWFKNTAVEKERLLEAAKEAMSSIECQEKNSNSESETEDDSEEVFEEAVQEDHDMFPTYQMANIYSFAGSNNFQGTIKKIMAVEAPISEEWLLKRIPWMFGREKVTKVVKDEYEIRMYRCEYNGIIRRNGFLYLEGATDYQLRVPGDTGEKRDISYISREELGSGMFEIVRQNVSIEKDSLYKFLAKLLGINRLTDKVIWKMDDALEAIRDLVEVNDDLISLRNAAE